MIEQETVKIDFSILGFWRHFAFVRFLYAEYMRTVDLHIEAVQKYDALVESKIQLTPTIKESNNIAVPFISETDDRDEAFYQRQPNESIEAFLERIGTYANGGKDDQPVTKTVRSANDLIEDARKAHIKSFLPEDKEESKNIIVSDNAVDRIGNEIAAIRG